MIRFYMLVGVLLMAGCATAQDRADRGALPAR